MDAIGLAAKHGTPQKRTKERTQEAHDTFLPVENEDDKE